MRGPEPGQVVLFSCVVFEERIPADHPLRPLKALVEPARSERQVMEQRDCDLLYRWFVGLGVDEAVWHPTTFNRNRGSALA